MKRPTRTAAAVALTAALTTFLSVPAVASGHTATDGHDEPGPVRVHDAKTKGSAKIKGGAKAGVKGGPVVKAPATPKSTVKVAQEKAKVNREITRKETALTRAVTGTSIGRLSLDLQAGVLANTAADRLALAALRSQANDATLLDDLRQISRGVAAVRPEVYAVVLADLHKTTRLQAAVTTQRDDLAAESASLLADQAAGADVAADLVLLNLALSHNAAAQDAVDSAVAAYLAIRATSARAEILAAQRYFPLAQKSLAAADQVLDSLDPADPTGRVA